MGTDPEAFSWNTRVQRPPVWKWRGAARALTKETKKAHQAEWDAAKILMSSINARAAGSVQQRRAFVRQELIAGKTASDLPYMLLSDSQSLYSGKKHEYKECFLPEGSAGLVNHENARNGRFIWCIRRWQRSSRAKAA